MPRLSSCFLEFIPPACSKCPDEGLCGQVLYYIKAVRISLSASVCGLKLLQRDWSQACCDRGLRLLPFHLTLVPLMEPVSLDLVVVLFSVYIQALPCQSLASVGICPWYLLVSLPSTSSALVVFAVSITECSLKPGPQI